MATTATVPVMFSFGIEYSVSCFWLVEVDREETLAQLVDKFGPDDWGDISTHIWVKVSHSKSGTYDKFNLNNTVGLVLRVLKSDVLWIKFEKSLPPPKNAFKLFFNAQNRKRICKAFLSRLIDHSDGMWRKERIIIFIIS